MKAIRKRFFAVTMLLVLTATALCGCKGGKNNTSSNNDSLEPKYGGEVVVGIQQDIDSLDPHVAQAAGTREILFNIFEGLVKPDANGNMIPAVADSYTVSEDNLTYTFKLRKGVKFHNGNAVKAEDIKYSLDRAAGLLKEGDTPLISALAKLKSVEIVDETTINVVLKNPDSEMIYYFNVGIIPKDSDKTDNIVGTGPFKLEKYSAQEKVVLAKNPEYWKAGVPYLDKVTFKIVSDTDSAMLFLKGGSIDIYPYLTMDQAAELNDNLEVISHATNTIQAMFLNNAVKPLDNPDVRRAICYAVNVDEINEFVCGSKAQKVCSSMIPGLKDYYLDVSDMYNVNTKKAKELLEKAGYADGFELEVTYPSNYQMHVDASLIIAQQLKAVGIKVKLNPVDWNTWLKDVYNGRKYQATVCAITSELSPGYLLSRYDTNASKNFINYKNSEYDKCLQLANNTADKAVKVENYKKMQQLLADEAASVYMQVVPTIVAKKKNIGGYTFYPVYVQDMSTVYIAD